MYAFILSLLPHRADAHDVLQETCLVLFRRFDDFCPQAAGGQTEAEAFIKWGCGIAINQVRRLRQRRARLPQFSDRVLDRIAAARQEHADLLELRRRFLPSCIDRLSESDRELISRCLDSGTTIKAVAEELQRPVNTIYKTVNRIRATLRRCIDLAVRRDEEP